MEDFVYYLLAADGCFSFALCIFRCLCNYVMKFIEWEGGWLTCAIITYCWIFTGKSNHVWVYDNFNNRTMSAVLAFNTVDHLAFTCLATPSSKWKPIRSR